jgi:single-strand DNA-binding protein
VSNSITIIGRLGADPELRQAGDRAVCSMRLADDRRAKGEKQTTWWGVTAWGKLGETCAQHLGKGRLVAVVGEAYARQWTDKQGQERTSLEVEASRVDFLDAPPAREDAPRPAAAAPAPQGGGWDAPRQAPPNRAAQSTWGQAASRPADDDPIPF